VAIYPYRCPTCGRAWEVIQSPLAQRDAHCECGAEGKRVWTDVKVYSSSVLSSFTPGYDVGLGKTFGTARERQRYLDSRGDKIKKEFGRPKGVRV